AFYSSIVNGSCGYLATTYLSSFEQKGGKKPNMKSQETIVPLDEESVPLGVLLSEEMPKVAPSMSVPTSAYWTGSPDEGNRDPDT
ncbi:MAG: hypothetical protein Q8P21_01525, partial [bacterium]|nr:hypothetical protein [bacterium]